MDFVRLIVAANKHANAPLDIHFAMPVEGVASGLYRSTKRIWQLARSRISNSNFSHGGPAALAASARKIVSDYPIHSCGTTSAAIVATARRIDAGAVFPTLLPLAKFSGRRVGYIFDFQHRDLPHLFSSRERQLRDENFSLIARSSDGIVVNSRRVAAQVSSFLSYPSDRIFAMPFSPYLSPEAGNSDPDEVASKYQVRGRYILVCNHFWKHKDHPTALRAFASVVSSDKFKDARLVLTGDPIDYRDATYYPSLLRTIRELGIEDRISILGLIPKADQLALVKNSVCVVQPTLYEGGPGGGAAYDAIGLGVPVILSDIPINKEVDIGNVAYFEAGSADSLAIKMRWTLDLSARFPDEAVLRSQSASTLARLGDQTRAFLERVSVLPPNEYSP